MRFNQRYAHFLILLILPLLVAWFELSLTLTLGLLLVWIVIGWVMKLTSFRIVPSQKLILETIPPSHFVEKVRWCLDRCSIDYVEHANGGTLGAFYTGRTVPRLRAYTGGVWSSLGNSDEILRFVWGQYGHILGDQGAFLEPTTERIAFEQRLEKYGKQLQVWIYSHILGERDVMLHAWGCNDPKVPASQRWLLRVLYPVQVMLMRKAFRLDSSALQRSRERIEPLLKELNTHLEHHAYLVGAQRSYVDYTFASLSALWIQPEQFGNGAADGVQLPIEQYPAGVLADREDWSKRFPHVVSFVNQLYQTERQAMPALPERKSGQ